jgi:MarR family transcriptional regulator for hemolysin
MRPTQTPIGLHLSRAARTLSRAFDDALTAAGGSLPTWLVLLTLKIHPTATQRELAAAIGLTDATVTHHLNAMEADGLITRRRDPANRRVHIVEPTDAGEDAFQRLRAAAVAFDRRIRRGLTAEEIEGLRGVLDRLVDNVDSPSEHFPTA